MTKIGIVGIGDISGIYLKNITETFKELQLVGVCDLIKERALNAQKKYNIPKVYDTMYDLFADSEIELVLNLTRPAEHFEVSKQALLSGKHVYSEKPLGASLEEGKELVALAKEKGLMLGGAPDTFLGAGIQTCRKLIDSGIIGDVVGASGAMICRGHETWHPDPEFYYKYGGGPMLDMGPYYVTALVNLIGRVEKVTGVTKISFPQRMITSKPLAGTVIDVTAPTYVTGILHFENGAIANLTTTFDVYKSDSHDIEIYGSKGTLFVPDPNCFGGNIRFFDGETKEMKEFPLEFDYAENSRALGLADMAKAIETGRRPRTSYKQTFHVLEIMQAFAKSSAEGRTVEIESAFEREAPLNPNCEHGILD